MHMKRMTYLSVLSAILSIVMQVRSNQSKAFWRGRRKTASLPLPPYSDKMADHHYVVVQRIIWAWLRSALHTPTALAVLCGRSFASGFFWQAFLSNLRRLRLKEEELLTSASMIVIGQLIFSTGGEAIRMLSQPLQMIIDWSSKRSKEQKWREASFDHLCNVSLNVLSPEPILPRNASVSFSSTHSGTGSMPRCNSCSGRLESFDGEIGRASCRERV